MKNFNYFFLLGVVVFFMTSCFGDLDTIPIDEDILTSEVFYRQEGAYKAVLAKIYAGQATTGQQGPTGQGDLSGIDEGFSQYLRQYWYQQELTTDEAVVGWADATIKDFHDLDWTPTDVFINAFYNRIFYQIGICNEFLRQTQPDVLSRRETAQDLIIEIEKYRAETRFMRALSYWHALDLFRNVPFVTEEDEVAAFNPVRIEASELFLYIESELKDIEERIIGPRQNEYARADRASVWMLLAKLYLNAEVYIGEKRYDDCLEYCRKIIGAGYELDQEFEHLFLADNHNSNEIIFPIAYDGLYTQTWGGTTFLIHASIGGDLDPADSGVNSGWAGLRTTPQIVEKFGDIGGVIKDFFPRINHPQVYIPGEYQGNDPTNSDYAITDSDGDGVYVGYQYFEQDSTTFVFAPNPTLSFVYGDNDGDGVLEIGGAPLFAGKAGFYFISFDNNNKTYVIEKRNWFVSGSAVDAPTPLEWDPNIGMLKVELNLSQGSFVFMADDPNSTSLGDIDSKGILTIDGDPITVDQSGPVEILLDLRKEEFVYKISSTSYDRRGIFGTEGQSLDIDDISNFRDGYAVLKFKNITSTGVQGSNSTFPDTDFPMFRLADVYLMASECILRGANGSMDEAVDYFNIVRSRAYKSQLANVTSGTLDLQMIIDERARELMWEGHRRSDLIRFGLFTSDDYLWQWKGAVKEGRGVGSYRRVFPIPEKDLNNNPNLVQNEGY